MLDDAKADEGKLMNDLSEVQGVIKFCLRRIAELEAQTPTLPGLQMIGEREFLGMKLPEAMRSLINHAGRPLHVKEMAHQLVKGGFQTQDLRMLKISIPTAAKRRGDLFVKTAPNTFGLRNGEAS
jgi:hypothetical protein